MPGPGGKKPRSNAPLLETRVWFPEMGSPGRMVSAALAVPAQKSPPQSMRKRKACAAGLGGERSRSSGRAAPPPLRGIPSRERNEEGAEEVEAPPPLTTPSMRLLAQWWWPGGERTPPPPLPVGFRAQARPRFRTFRLTPTDAVKQSLLAFSLSQSGAGKEIKCSSTTLITFLTTNSVPK